MTPPRRQFVQSIAAISGGLALGSSQSAPRRQALYPQRLRPGDRVALVSPANATFEREPVEIATEALQAIGFKVRHGPNLLARYGHFAGSDAQRAGDINAMFADDSVSGILALTGGSGCNRIVDKLDYGLIAAKPKFFGGFSDLTSLLNAIQSQTGLVTFHCPMGASEWNKFSLESFRSVVMAGEAALLGNPKVDATSMLVQTHDRISTLRPGRASGRLVGGNLAVLSSLAGSIYWPDFRGAILFLEETNEYIYRVDRMLSTLRLAGALDQLAGVVLGKFTKCNPGDGFGTLTLDEVFDDYFKGLGVPVFRGAMIGHINLKHTLPIGASVAIDAEAGTIQLLGPAVL